MGSNRPPPPPEWPPPPWPNLLHRRTFFIVEWLPPPHLLSSPHRVEGAATGAGIAAMGGDATGDGLL
ncbi:hypothetical protein R6Q59_005049 [Mikania micrantha]